MAKIRCEYCEQRQDAENDNCQFCGAKLPDDASPRIVLPQAYQRTACATTSALGMEEVYYPVKSDDEIEDEKREYELNFGDDIKVRPEEDTFWSRLWKRMLGKE